MLDNTTKRRIDTARDILVGKVPDPKSQVEQITIALIYKFMDDMDKEAVDFGGLATFFTGEYEKYAWTKIFDPKLGGYEMLNLYSEAILKLNQNPNIPQLFRDIFKNAYLPYRDPETLKLFLKTINEFSYDHSEMLGDAFEYLLSVLGSQGDAGQFRTPRHIIDFMVRIVAPKKGEMICDPACGTAGFLISSYKYIVEQNTKPSTGSGHKGDLLTPDDRKKMMKQFAGYDISPDMVRLSLVNMYLHGFTSPKILEYDTLTSEERWNEYYDIILANPPFMTPKGGIKPHKKFTIQAGKSEVLFTDYIAEHINPVTGRAAIIVPNGIVATSQTAYKQLRKMLVKQSLIAVISLPAGVFQPYSGVKTSILILDKRLAKKANHILFLKIENDGYDLGAQRREIDKNDLPLALQMIDEYKNRLNKNSFDFDDYYDFIVEQNHSNPRPNGGQALITKTKVQAMATLVEKERVLENKDVVLSAERYIEISKSQTEFELVKLGDERYFKIESGGTPSSVVEEYWNGTISWATLKDLPAADFITTINDTERKITELGLAKSSAKLLPENSILVSSRATIGRIAINKVPVATNQGFKNIVIVDFSKAIPEYVAFALTQKVEEMNEMASGSTFKEISKANFSEIQIPLPPLSIQQQIVAEIEGYQKIIDSAKQIIDNYKPVIHINPDWKMVELGEVCKINPQKSELKDLSANTRISFVPMADLNENQIDFIPKEIKPLSEVIGGYTYFRNDDVLVAKVTPCFENGKAGIAKNLVNGIGFGSSEYYVLRSGNNVLPLWIYLQIKSLKFATEGKAQMSGTSGLQRIPKDFVSSFLIPLPPLTDQQSIVNSIEEEMQLVSANKRLIEIFEQKIKDKINEVWGVKEKPKAKEYTIEDDVVSKVAEE